MIEIKEDAAQLLAFDTNIDSEMFKSWIMQYINEDKLEPILESLRNRGVDQLIVLQDLEVPHEQKGQGIGTRLMKQFMTTYGSQEVVLIAEAFGTNLVNLEEWYGKYQFQTVCGTQAGPLMLYKL